MGPFQRRCVSMSEGTGVWSNDKSGQEGRGSDRPEGCGVGVSADPASQISGPGVPTR